MSLIADLDDGTKREITRADYEHSREVLPPVAHDFTWNDERWDFGFSEGLDYVYAFQRRRDRYYAQKTPLVNPKECGRSLEDQQHRLEPPLPGRLSKPWLDAILTRLRDHGYAREADEPRGHVRALLGERQALRQLYEEYVIPLTEGRLTGPWAGRAAAKVPPAPNGGPGRTP